jgi:hypothetical protein
MPPAKSFPFKRHAGYLVTALDTTFFSVPHDQKARSVRITISSPPLCRTIGQHSLRCQAVALVLSNLVRNVPFVTSLEVSPFCFGSSCFFRRWPGPERSPAEPEGRSGEGEAEGQVNDGRAAVAANFLSRCCFPRRDRSLAS